MSQTPEPPKKRSRSTKATTATMAGGTAKASPSSKASTPKTKAKASSTRTRKPKANSMTAVTPELRYRMIAEAAFYIAEKHGFDPNRSIDDWLEAEVMIDERLRGTLTH